MRENSRFLVNLLIILEFRIMKTVLTVLLFMFIGFNVSSQSFQDFINDLNNLPVSERMDAVDEFMDLIEPMGIPYVNSDTANFIYRGDVSSVGLPGDFSGWDPSVYTLNLVVGTDFWYFSKTFEMNARLDYKYVLDGSNWILDPLNPNQVSGGYGPNSELAMPDYIQPWEIETIPGVEQGTIESENLQSANTGSSFQVKIYLPPNYNPERTNAYPVAYFQDGTEYLSLGSATNVIDNLIDQNLMDELIAVFVRPNDRNEEYAGNLRNEYRMFFVEELVPFIDENYNTINHPVGRAVIGPSFGGNISALISYNHPDVFGMCGLHSGAFWPNDYEAFDLITQGDVENIRFASIWGTYESLYENMREFRDFLNENNYELAWDELPEGHSWGLWRATIDDILIFFYPPGYSDLEENIHQKSIPVSIVPNPVVENASIIFTLKNITNVSVDILNITGQTIMTQSNIKGQLGDNLVNIDFSKLSEGIYFISLKTNDIIHTTKIIKR